MWHIISKKEPAVSIFKMYPSKRNMWAYLNIIFNLVDKKRIEEIGPDRACAEWLIRNGGGVTFEGSEPTKDYDLLAAINPVVRLKLIDIDASDASITHHGFQHLIGCNHIRSIRLHKCWYVNDTAVTKLSFVKDSLAKLQIASCDEVTDAGVMSIAQLRNLRQLSLIDLRVKDLKACEVALQKALPNCNMTLN